MSSENEAPESETSENPEITVPRKQRFKPSVLEVMIGSLILLGIMYLAYLVLNKETGDTRGMEARIKALEARSDQRGLALEKGLEALKESSRQLEPRLKALEDHRKQVDSRVEGLAAKAAPAPPKVAAEDKKPAAVAPAPPKVAAEDKKPAAVAPAPPKVAQRIRNPLQWPRFRLKFRQRIGNPPLPAQERGK